MDFGIHRGPETNPLRIRRDNLSFWAVESYTGIYNCAGVGGNDTPNPTPNPYSLALRVNCNLYNYATGNSWFTFFMKDKRSGANQNLLTFFSVFLVIFLFELKSQADSNLMIKVTFCYFSNTSFCPPQNTEIFIFLKLIDYDHNV